MDEECPPGAEGYEDSVTQKTSKNPLDECTKAEQEFQEHLNSLKIKLENGEARPMVERRGRDVSGKWIYLCFPCGAMCSGESVLQTHISGKKHKTKLAMRSIWPNSIFEEHPYVMHEKGNTNKSGTSEKVLQKMAEEVDLHNKPSNELDCKYNKYRDVRCHIQDTIDLLKAPLLGVEYLIEHPPEQSHYEPSYICVLCSKQGHPRTIMNHMTCFWHRYNYMVRHFPKASALLAPYRSQNKYREGVYVIMNRLAQRIEDKYGRLRPVNIDKEEYDRDKEVIHLWLFKSKHFSEEMGHTFEEVVDADLITSLHKSNEDAKKVSTKPKDPSPPVVAAPTKPNYMGPHGKHQLSNKKESSKSVHTVESSERRLDKHADALSDVSDEHPRRAAERERDDRFKHDSRHDSRYRPYEVRRREDEVHRSRYSIRNPPADKKPAEKEKKPPNYEYKVKLAEDKRISAEESAKKTLAYHEKNPEKHPLYPEEWKKFWNRRYKEIQAEGKDPSKHDFKPEWIVFWTSRMKELHDEELRVNIIELYRKMCLTPPDMTRRSEPRKETRPTERRSAERRRSPDPRRRSPEPRRRSGEPRRRSPEPRRRSPEPRRRSPERRRSPDRRRSPPERRRSPPDYRRERRSPEPRRHSPARHLRTRSRSPLPAARTRSPARTHITLDSLPRRSRSPLSRRNQAARNRSPAPPAHQGPASQTVMISDDELKPDDALSPWNSDNDIESLPSLPDARSPVRSRSHASSRASRPRQFPAGGYGRGAEPQDLGPPENVVATLRVLVALEDYLGSLGPKVVDLMTEALKMEKDKPNSSEELLDRESAVVLMETAKEKLKGSMQAGLVPPGVHGALRAAVVRAASTLHEADTRAKRKQQSAGKAGAAGVAVAGVGEVDRAQIAQQMAAALVAQGKTDVSAEELAQLVDAVVGMAEAKKREAEIKKKQEQRSAARPAPAAPAPAAPAPAPKLSSGSALQMLQSAYDENDKRVEKEEAPDAMDGLSDSDLETLLKNFNELSAEEQHSLIAYLKKLEAREPERVERLRQYVSADPAAPPAAHPASAPAPANATAPAPAPRAMAPALAPAPAPAPAPALVNTVTIESDDDDYTVDDVLNSAKQKVKEDQIRQEMEIVKKSLETKSDAAEAMRPNVISSAAGLLALVQASIQSAAPPARAAGVVASAQRPRLFGDAAHDHPAPPPPHRPTNTNNFGGQNLNELAQNQSNFGCANQSNFGGSQDNFSGTKQSNFGDPNQDNFGGPNQDNFGGTNQDNFGGPIQNNFDESNQDNLGGSNQNNFDESNQDNFGGPNQNDFDESNQDNFGGPNQDNYDGSNQGDFGEPNQDNFGGKSRNNFGEHNQDNFGGMNQGNFGGMNQDNFGGMNQGNFGEPKQGNFGVAKQGNFGAPKQGNFGATQQGNFGSPNQSNFGTPNQGNLGTPNQGNFGTPNQGNLGKSNQGNFGAPNQSNFGAPNQGNFGAPNQGNFGGMNQGNFGRPNQNNLDTSNRGNFGGQGNFVGNRNFSNQQGNTPWEKTPVNDNTIRAPQPLMRTPTFGNFGPNQANNQGQMGNFMNGRMQDNYDMRPMNQQMGGNFQGNNFRGRGGGRGNFRGRGRGFF